MGNVFKYGDNIDTDVIIPARHLLTSDPEELAEHCMEDIDSSFSGKVKKGDIIVAGDNFGCGSSREHAPIAIKGSGIKCVIAPSFARIFYRNAFNTGLPILESREAYEKTDAGDEVKVDFKKGKITNITKNETYDAEPFPDFMSELIASGGLVGYVKKSTKAKAGTAGKTKTKTTRTADAKKKTAKGSDIKKKVKRETEKRTKKSGKGGKNEV